MVQLIIACVDVAGKLQCELCQNIINCYGSVQ